MSEFEILIGQVCRGSWLGYGTRLFLQFGEVLPEQQQFVRGRRLKYPARKWSLSADHIQWRIERGAKVLGGAADKRSVMEAAVAELEGKKFLAAQLLPAGDAVFTFDEDTVVRSFVISSEEDSRWVLRDKEDVYTPIVPRGSWPEEAE